MTKTKLPKKLNRLLRYLFLHRQTILLLTLVVVSGIIIDPQTVFAAPQVQGGSSIPTAQELFPGSASVALEGLSTVFRVLQIILWPILFMIGSLLQNDILFNPVMQDKLYDIWSTVRNMVNIISVVILLGIALYNVFGGSEQDYHLKAILPKFVIALIGVNFTFFGIKFLLDTVNVVATAIFALPDTVQTSLNEIRNEENGWPYVVTPEQTKTLCQVLIGVDPAQQEAYNAKINDLKKAINKKNEDSKNKVKTNADTALICEFAAIEPKNKDPNAEKKPANYLNAKNDFVTKFLTGFNANNAAIILALNTQKIDIIGQVNKNVDSLATLGLDIILSLVLFVIYGAAYVALFAILLVRVVVMWLIIAISPLMVLPMILPEKIKSKLGEMGDMSGKLISNAVAPIPIAFVMSVGFILLDAFGKAHDAVLASDTSSFSFLSSGAGTLQELIAGIGAAAFIWVGVFAAAKDTFADQIVDKIKGTVAGAGGAIAQLPLMVPIFPLPGKDTASVALGELPIALRRIEQRPSQILEEMTTSHFGKGPAEDALAKIKPENIKNIEDLRQSLGGTQSFLDQKSFYPGLGEKLDAKKNLIPAFALTGIKDFENQPVSKFIEALKRGGVSKEQLERFYSNLQVPLTGPTNSGTATSASGKPAGTDTQLSDTEKKTATAMMKTMKPAEKAEYQKALNGKASADELKKIRDAITAQQEKPMAIIATLGEEISTIQNGPDKPEEAAKKIGEKLVEKQKLMVAELTKSGLDPKTALAQANEQLSKKIGGTVNSQNTQGRAIAAAATSAAAKNPKDEAAKMVVTVYGSASPVPAPADQATPPVAPPPAPPADASAKITPTTPPIK